MKLKFMRKCLLALALSAGAASQAFAGGLDEMHQFVSQVKSASGDFSQRQMKPVKGQVGALEPTGTSSGTFAFARPGKFVWLYQKPYQQLLQADGQTLYVYDKDLNQVTERPLGNALGASPAAILFGSNDLDKNFTVKDGGTKEGVDWVELVPKAQDTQFKRIGVGFKAGNLDSMELYDVFGNVTLLSFQNIQKNPAATADRFKFVVPKGADVIKG
ncbi:outer membrane lipoprotein chaperone LolA [Robbsia sp. Bb-Pol-6]|uniref:Outer-membrane lipoprotein carrier protein n=1 Tax=Robbsia betulipollinis TaxID=2981849 RepID=A0ABT3ZNE4_9BURK|nr:outer membrane lipoprotein chaperone LolA [Robbsia betulipollinis]MCY0387470.1 outer membrane lipoprotein chaperone LolA [Robbsia betulipollinis]